MDHFSGVASKRRCAPEGAAMPRRSTRSPEGLSVAPPLSEKRVWRPRGSGWPRSGFLACSSPPSDIEHVPGAASVP